jgi:hypothetical protein
VDESALANQMAFRLTDFPDGWRQSSSSYGAAATRSCGRDALRNLATTGTATALTFDKDSASTTDIALVFPDINAAHSAFHLLLKQRVLAFLDTVG